MIYTKVLRDTGMNLWRRHDGFYLRVNKAIAGSTLAGGRIFREITDYGPMTWEETTSTIEAVIDCSKPGDVMGEQATLFEMA